jgi:hypothetical protein
MLEVTTRTVPDSSRRAPLYALLWLGLGLTLAVAGAATSARPLVPAFIIASCVGWTLAYARDGGLRRWLDGLPLRVVIAAHAVRLPIGALFLWEESRGLLSPSFALRAGYGDIVIGALAIVVAVVGWQRRRVVGAFAVAGLIDILIAVGTAMSLLFVAHDPLMLGAIARLPYPILPFAIVPAVIATHLLMLARLRELR